jgi:hypothetical protein
MISEGRECKSDLPFFPSFSTFGAVSPLEAFSAEFLKNHFTSWTSIPENNQTRQAIKKWTEQERIPPCKIRKLGKSLHPSWV